MNPGHSRRDFLRTSAYVGGAFLLASCTTDPAKKRAATPVAAKLPPIEGARVITDPARLPTTFSESPEFAALVQAGKLPPVEERIGQDPLVLEAVDGIGAYGGKIRRAHVGIGDFQAGSRFVTGPDSLLFWDYPRENIVPNLARDFEMSADARELTLHLRRGMKWSDGHPFTADDILFWRESVNLNTEIVPAGSATLTQQGGQVSVEKVDDFTVRYVCPSPHPLLPQLMAGYSDLSGMAFNGSLGQGGYLPKHYLSQFLPEFAGVKAVTKAAKDAGFDTWTLHFLDRATWYLNAELPVLMPWVTTRAINDPPWEHAANPYSIWVDTEGNQLPYISKVTSGEVESIEVISLRTVGGQLDFQDRNLNVASLPVLLKNQKRSDYTVHRTPNDELDFGVRFNLAYEKDKVLGDLIRTTDFRRALSLGIERNQINETFFLGESVPTAPVPADDSPFSPGPEWRTKWATHNVRKANALLDGIGLTKKDSKGYRIRPDGDGPIRLEYAAGVLFVDFPAIGEMIKRQWREIGIDLQVETMDGTLLVEAATAGTMMLTGHQVGTDDPLLKPDGFLPALTSPYQGLIGIPYAQWMASGGEVGTKPPKSLARLTEAMELFAEGRATVSEQRRIAISKRLFRMHADEVWSIGVVGFGLALYGMYAANNGLANVPARIGNNLHQKTVLNAYPMTFYYT